MTPIRQNCKQSQSKGLNVKSDVAVNVDVFNRRLVTQLPKVALDYAVGFITYCPTRKFYSNLRCVETFSHTDQYTYIYYVGPKFTDCLVFHVGTLHCQNNYVL